MIYRERYSEVRKKTGLYVIEVCIDFWGGDLTQGAVKSAAAKLHGGSTAARGTLNSARSSETSACAAATSGQPAQGGPAGRCSGLGATRSWWKPKILLIAQFFAHAIVC